MKTPRLFLSLPLCLMALLPAVADQGKEIGFIEKFALAQDRSEVLSELIPGTTDYYYFHCLHLEQTEQWEEQQNLLNQWAQRDPNNPRKREIEYRRALLTYEQSPQGTLEFIRRELNLNFNHQQDRRDRAPDLPAELDQNLIARERFLETALRNSRSLDQVADEGLDWLMRNQVQLTREQQRDLLRRLQWPDYPGLVDMIASDLATRESRGFGEFNIHRRLTLAQLIELAQQRPELLRNLEYINQRLIRLRPNDDVNWRFDLDEKQAYLQRVWDFVEELDPSQNSLKAHVLYHLLDVNRQLGNYNRDLFLTYLKLPRQVSYMEPDYLNQPQFRGHTANLGQDFSNGTTLPPAGADQPLVEDYLAEFIREDLKPDAFETYVRESFLEALWAEVMLLTGKGNPESWFSILGPTRVQELKERVDIDLRPSNPNQFSVGDPVQLVADVKNVSKMIVKIYEINTLNYYLKTQSQLDTAINLDGLTANRESTFEYDLPALRSERRTYDFPSLKGKRGVWVIEFIGGGKSSRALIRKGNLQYLSETTAAGEVLTILDENNQQLPNSAIWLNGTRYAAEEDGKIILPFSGNPGSKTIVLQAGTFASLDRFQHKSENYQLHAGIFVDREQLIARKKATVLIKPRITVSSVPSSLAVLQEIVLDVDTETVDGVTSSDRITDLELNAENEATHTFTVPDRLRSITFNLSAKVERPSQGDKADVSASETFHVNQIDTTQRTRALFLTRFGNNWFLEVLGKNGEPIPETPVNASFWHHDFKFNRNFSLKTNEQGRINLGQLDGISRLTASTPTTETRNWNLPEERHTRKGTITAEAGETIRVPYTGTAENVRANQVALFALRGDTIREDLFEKLSLQDRQYVIDGLTPGDYRMLLRDEGRTLSIRVADGVKKFGYVLGNDRHLELPAFKSTAIVSAGAENEAMVLRLDQTNDLTRVHIFADRFFPAFDTQRHLGSLPGESLNTIRRAQAANSYVSGRLLGEEHRYILERRQEPNRLGNMLDRPRLILNPWELRSTDTERQTAALGEEYDRKKEAEMAKREADKMPAVQDPVGDFHGSYQSLDFLASTSATLTNLQPGDDGVVRVPLNELGDRQWIRIVVTDPAQTLTKDVFLDQPDTEFRDIRLPDALDPEKAYSQKKQTTVLDEGEELELSSTEFNLIDKFGDLHPIFVSLTENEDLAEFAFLLNWHEMENDEKRENYSKYASHELHFFLSRRDPEFFNAVVKPYLANKRNKTFLDEYLLGENLERYLQLYEFNRLNVAEKLLLARRLGGDQQERIERHVLDDFALLPPNPQEDDTLFETALRSKVVAQDAALAPLEERMQEAGEGDQQANRRRETKKMPGEAAVRALAKSETAPAPAAAPMADGFGGGYALKAQQRELAEKQEAAKESLPMLKSGVAGDRLSSFSRKALLDKRKEIRQLYRKLDETKVWAENNYYHVPIEEQIASLITVNEFWRDYAAWDGEGEFYSSNFTHATKNLSEMIYALSLIGLPAESAEHEIEAEDGVLKITAGSPAIVFHQEVQATERAEEASPLLVSQNFFDPEDRYEESNGERTDKFITEEFLAGKTYGCQIVVTNPTSSRRSLDLFTQIPEKSLPVAGARKTHGRNVSVEPFSTQRFEYHFYFPKAEGEHAHYPVQLVRNDQVVASATPFSFQVVEELTQIDRASWDYVSQFGSEEEVMRFLTEENLGRLDLGRIAWRMKDEAFFQKVTNTLSRRGTYHPVLWSYSIHHNDPEAAREFLLAQEGFMNQCGLYIHSPLVVSNPVQRHRYQHLEYAPLVNARAHRLGAKQKILNDDLWKQYHQFLTWLSYEKALSAEQHLAASYYLLLQDRVDRGMNQFATVQPANITEQLQHDYLTCYVAFYEGDTAKARQMAAPYADYPVDRWQQRFAAVLSQLEEIDGEAAAVQNPEERDQVQDQLASTEPTLNLEVEDKEIRLNASNLEEVTINFYEMDLEFLFSSDPFVSGESGRFSMIQPNDSMKVEIDEDKPVTVLPLPQQYRSSNVLIEAVSGRNKKSETYYANSLSVNLVEEYGRLQVMHHEDRKPLPRTYVKVYARMQDGSVEFYKDGYTDLRGKFDYLSLNTDELARATEFSILISHEEHGSLVTEAKPPNR